MPNTGSSPRPGAEQRRADASEIFAAAVAAADPRRCVFEALHVDSERLLVGGRSYDLARFAEILVIGAGKATPAMAAAVEERLGDRITAGAINTKYGHAVLLQHIETTEAGHPLPDEAGVAGTLKMLELAGRCGDSTLLLCLFSGGGSALMPAPVPEISLAEKQQTTRELLACGATIGEINAVRKHLSRVKGGRLARLSHPAPTVSLMISDVIGDRLDTIASGPTYPDSTSFADCDAIFSRYGIGSRIPQAVLSCIEEGRLGNSADTPGAGEDCFRNTLNLVVGNNGLAVGAAERKARELGYEPLVLSSRIAGETREVAGVHVAIAEEAAAAGNPVAPPACIISGGETTVAVRGTGKGGRNQEFALAATLLLDGSEAITVLSGGTDGTDGPTDAAGAVCDGRTAARARDLGLDPDSFLDNNDSYHFFRPLGDLLMTGPTGTNVMDLRLMLVS